jgi:hypothetical protein
MLHYDAINATTISNIPKNLNEIYIYLKIKVIKFIDHMIGPIYFRVMLQCCNIDNLAFNSII